jgi:hypothetical protein
LAKQAQITREGLAPLPSEQIEEATGRVAVLLHQASLLGRDIGSAMFPQRAYVPPRPGKPSDAKTAPSLPIAAALIAHILDRLHEKAKQLVEAAIADGSWPSDGKTTPASIVDALSDWLGDYAELIAISEVGACVESAIIAVYQEHGVRKIRWVAHADACEICLKNDTVGAIPLGSPFPSGDIAPPAHPRCRCVTAPA